MRSHPLPRLPCALVGLPLVEADALLGGQVPKTAKVKTWVKTWVRVCSERA